MAKLKPPERWRRKRDKIMEANDFQKGFDYAKVRARKDDDLQWARNVIKQLWNEEKINGEECTRFLESLTERRRQE